MTNVVSLELERRRRARNADRRRVERAQDRAARRKLFGERRDVSPAVPAAWRGCAPALVHGSDFRNGGDEAA